MILTGGAFRRLVWACLALATASCASSNASLPDPTLQGPGGALPAAPVTLELTRVTASGQAFQARHDTLLISDQTLRVTVKNRTCHHLYLKVDQQPTDDGTVPLQAPVSNSSFREEDHGLYKLDSDSAVSMEFPVQPGLRDGHVTLHVLNDASGDRSYAEAHVAFAPRPSLAFYGDDDLPVKTSDGRPQFQLDPTGVSGLARKRFFVEMVPGPANGATCTVALESLAPDGTVISRVLATLGGPTYRDGPFLASAGQEVLANAGQYHGVHAADGDPRLDPSSPAPHERTDLITEGDIRVRPIGCR